VASHRVTGCSAQLQGLPASFHEHGNDHNTSVAFDVTHSDDDDDGGDNVVVIVGS